MKNIQRNLLMVSSLLIMAMPAYADDYHCSYSARISDADKYNSKGVLIAQNYSNNTVAAILRQDRANYYVYGKASREDEGDCVFNDKEARAKMQSFLASASIPQYARRIIIDNNPLIEVDIYSKHIEVRIIEEDEGEKTSSIR